MDSFTILDAVVAVVVVLSALLAYSRGFMRELMSIVGWVAATILAFIFADAARPFMQQIPVVGEFLGRSCELSIIASFSLVFILALIIVSLFTPLFASLIQRSVLGGVDQALGFVFGVVRGILLVFITFFLYETLAAGQEVEMVEKSRSKVIYDRYAAGLERQNPDEAMGWVTTQYEQLIGACE